ncbi:MAG: thiamine phosphate synthase [Sulfurimonas sp.]|jgi:thiamine-phosphate pyrophosphorylase|nr:thiamine phosphate synthase [Sulfurimonas sp.]
MDKKLQGLYAITDEVLTPDDTVLTQVREALEAGVKILQYRNKNASDSEVKEIGADGLHIGKDDMPLSEVREIFPKGIIGVSCYGSVKKALETQAEGASYVAFGSFFPSPTKPHSGIVNKSVVTKAKESLEIPVCVIGGISAANIHEMAALHPDMISVVSAVFDGNITHNVKNLLQKI